MRGGEGSRAHGAPRCFPQQATCQVTPVQLQLWAQMPGCGAALREARGGRTKGGSSAGHAKSSPGHFCATSGGLFGTGVGRTPGELTAPTNPLDSTAQTGRGTRADGQRDGISTSQRADTPPSVTSPDGAQAASAFSCQGFGEVSEAPGGKGLRKGRRKARRPGTRGDEERDQRLHVLSPGHTDGPPTRS